eukprot:3693970-Amphidinium_carterae.1
MAPDCASEECIEGFSALKLERVTIVSSMADLGHAATTLDQHGISSIQTAAQFSQLQAITLTATPTPYCSTRFCSTPKTSYRVVAS